MSSTSKTPDLVETILRVVREEKPQTVSQLLILSKVELQISEDEIFGAILDLQNKGILKLEEQAILPRSLVSYLKTGETIWYWATIAAEAITTIFVLTISENAYPWIYLRNVLGVIFVLFLPGYALMKALFPTKIANKTSAGTLQIIERISLSIGLSIALVPAVGLLLYYSPWGLDLAPVVLSLLALTSIFATVAVIREKRVRNQP
jgi:hypothetical protein